MAKVVLGRGLGSLIQTRAAAEAAPGETVRQISLEQIRSSPLQPRKDFKADNLHDLVESIRERGIIQPLIVRKVGDHFELIAGERRWRAARTLGLANAPTILREASDQEVLELALIENLQRADLTVLEEAHAYARLANEFALRQEDIAQKVGKSRAAVANAMRLLDLDPQVQSWLTQERLTVGHAKVLLGLKNPEEQRMLAEVIIRQHSTVRSAEKLVAEQIARQGASGMGPGSRKGGNGAAGLSPALQHLQNRLREHLSTHVSLRHGEKKGAIEIEYYGNDDLQRVLGKLGLKNETL